MNKRKIGALLIGATLLVGALGSFAYFNGKSSTINGNGTGALQALSITNGQITVSAKVTGESSSASDWSYDVVKYSLEQSTTRNESFINKHRSPDINAVSKEVVAGSGSDIKRAKIGSVLETPVINARPGDAIVLGVENENGETGVVVTNESNLTVKMQLVTKNDDTAKAAIEAINKAGWKMYINGTEVKLANGEIFDLGVVGPTGTVMLQEVRFELPLKTGNEHQGNATDESGSISSLDLSQIIEIQATQENNDGWNEDGTGDRITK